MSGYIRRRSKGGGDIRFTGLFDVIVFGIMAENQLENEIADLLKPKARLVFETVDYLSKLKAD